MQSVSLQEINKLDTQVQGRVVDDFQDGDLQATGRQYDPKDDQRDMNRLGKSQELKVLRPHHLLSTS